MIILLRAINVGGKNKLPMVELKELLNEMGLKNHQTYLNTGNVVVVTTWSHEEIETKIEEAILDKFGFSIEVIAFNEIVLNNMIKEYPFKELSKHAYVTIFKSEMLLNLDVVDQKKHVDDVIEIHTQLIYLNVPNGYGKTKLTNAFFEKQTGIKATTRNLKTLIKLQDITKLLSGC